MEGSVEGLAVLLPLQTHRRKGSGRDRGKPASPPKHEKPLSELSELEGYEEAPEDECGGRHRFHSRRHSGFQEGLDTLPLMTRVTAF